MRPNLKPLHLLFAACSVALLSLTCVQKRELGWIANAPAGSAYTAIHRDSVTVLPNGRLLTPAGRQITVAPHPYGLILSPDGTIAVTANSGVRPFSVTVIRNLESENPGVEQIPPGVANDAGVLASVYMGLAISPDNSRLYVAGGQEGEVYVFDLNTSRKVATIPCNGLVDTTLYSDSYIGDMVLSADGTRLYAVDQMNFRMLVIDPAAGRVVASVGVGRYPFGITLSPDGQRVWVANVGMFQYQRVKSFDPANPAATALKRPAFAYLSKEARDGIVNDTLNIPGLGDPNVPESFSVWSIDVGDEKNLTVTAKIKTGIKVGEMVEGIPAVGGSSPNSVVATDSHVFVSNGNNDCITVIDAATSQVITNLALQPDRRLGRLRGVIPYGLALSPDGRRLYVAESGINAVAVIDIPALSVLGHMPVCWFPSKLQVSRDGRRLFVANAKGFGSGPNGGSAADLDPRGTYVGHLMNGTVSTLEIPADSELERTTRQVIQNNFDFEIAAPRELPGRINPVPAYPGESTSPIHYIVYIVKENRTYDELFGQVKGGVGDPALARYGSGRTIQTAQGELLEDLTIMPNHLRLVERFALADNFYCDSDHSADGHRWLVGTYPNEWVETNVSAGYGGGRDTKGGSRAPGALAATGASAAIYPEDYNEAGSIWEHMERGRIDFYNFGLGLDLANNIEDMAFKYTGQRYKVNYPVPAPMYHRTSDSYPTWNMRIPDQFRADMFIKEFRERWLDPKKGMPRLITIYLPNDHGDDPRPRAGYPYVESYMMDNDLALGRIVDFLSHTPYWKKMAIFITEDDPQGGVDHIDAHRSALMVVSPWARKGHVSHVHYSFGSIMKTFWHILNLPHLNQFDFGATDLADCFSGDPDFTPYIAQPVDPDIFDPGQALTPLHEKFDWAALFTTPVLDDPELMAEWSENDRLERQRLAQMAFPPVIEPHGGLFMTEQRVELSAAGLPAEIRYTTDGSDPDKNARLYSGPFQIRESTTLKVRAWSASGSASRIKSATFTKAQLRPAVKQASRQPGLSYRYFEGAWQKLPDFERMPPLRRGVTGLPDLAALAPRADQWGVLFTGYVEVPEDGLYTVYLTSDDGSRLYLGSDLIIDNDGSHGPTEKSAEVALQKGAHAIKLFYFEDSEGQELNLSCAGPGIARQRIPASAFSH